MAIILGKYRHFDLEITRIFLIISRKAMEAKHGNAYWSNPGKDKTTEHRLALQIHLLGDDILGLKIQTSYKKELLDKLRNFRMQVTGGRFGSEDKTDEPGRINLIQELATDLCHALKENGS